MKARLSTVLVFLVGVVLLVSLTPGRALPVVAGSPSTNLLQQSVNSSSAENVEQIGHVSGKSYAVAVQGDYAYTGFESELAVVDVSNPANPLRVGFVVLPYRVEGVAVSGVYAYVLDDWGLRVVDVSNLAAPMEVGYYPTPGLAGGVEVVGSYVYVVTWEGTSLHVIDVSDPPFPQEVGYHEMDGSVSIAVAGEYAYVADYWKGLRVINISDPTAPVEITYYDPSGYTYQGVAVAGDYAYLTQGYKGLHVIDISSPAAPIKVGYYDTPGFARGVAAAGGYVYLADRGDGLRVIDVSNPAYPREVGYYETPDAYAVSLAGGYVYLADRDEGLFILRFMGAEPLSEQPVLLVPGWGGSEASLAVDEQLGFFRDWLGPGYVEGYNLFYATGLAAEKDTWGNALAIQEALQNAYDVRIDLDPSWDGHFDIIAHSYGGINSREYLESERYRQDREDRTHRKKGIHVDNLFTLGTPHGGEILPLPGALWIAGKHIVDPRDWGSLWQLTPWQMETFNGAHEQPDGICYRLIGGNAFEQDLPAGILEIYGYLRFIPNDLGVQRSSAQELGWWKDRYPKVLVESTPDMHGYFDMFGFDKIRSYVHPSDTFDEFIRNYLGTRQCVADSQTWSLLAEPETSALPIPSVLITSGGISGGVVSGDFQVNWSGQSVIYLNWPLGELELSLTDPGGTLIDPITVQSNPKVDYLELDVLARTASYVFTDMLVGTWAYTITATSVPYTVPYRLIALPSLPVAVTAQASSWQPQDQPAVISSTLTYSVTTLLTSAEVQALISRPDGVLDTLSLYDDGVHNDQMAGDGVYGNSYPETDMGGFYAVVVEATGVYQTEPYTRTAETSFSVSTGAASLTGEYSDEPRDVNSDGRYEWLDIGVKISVTQVGTYTLAADLMTLDDSYIGHALLRTGLLTGTHNLTLSFDGDDILESGQDGAYIVTGVLLVDSERASLLLDQAGDVHITAAYNHQQFGGWRVYLPLILKAH